MINRCIGDGQNPYTVNVISFSGHGIHIEGDAIAVIPQGDGDVGEPRFINLSAYGRKFAEKKNTLTVFICSMCRLELNAEEKKAVYQQSENKADSQKKDGDGA
jgi:hypothetical protein